MKTGPGYGVPRFSCLLPHGIAIHFHLPFTRYHRLINGDRVSVAQRMLLLHAYNFPQKYISISRPPHSDPSSLASLRVSSYCHVSWHDRDPLPMSSLLIKNAIKPLYPLPSPPVDMLLPSLSDLSFRQVHVSLPPGSLEYPGIRVFDCWEELRTSGGTRTRSTRTGFS